jgi:sulfatase modifying factor 1
MVCVFVTLLGCSRSRNTTDGEAGRPALSASGKGGGSAPHGADAMVAPEPTQSAPCEAPTVTSSCSAGMCFIPAGCYVMGVPRDELFAGAEDDVEVEVELTHGFMIGQTEVTRQQWLELGLPDPPPDWTETGSSDPSVPVPGYSLCTEPECPIVWVSFEDALAYANLRSEREGLKPCYLLSDCVRSPGAHLRCHSVRVDAKSPYECQGYRLPTEAEWEYAARAGTHTAYYSGDMNPDPSVSTDCKLDENLDAIGWYCGNSGGPLGQTAGHPHPVAQKRANAWGLFDVSGNAYEWTNDLVNPFGYGQGPLVDPVGGVSDPNDLTPARHPVWGDYNDIDGFPCHRVIRGGAFDLWSFVAKSGRRGDVGGWGGQDNGFRVVRTLDTPASVEAP